MIRLPTEISELLAKLNSRLRKILRAFCAIIMLTLTLDVLWGVLSRYILGEQSPFTEELARMLLIYATFFGGALAFDSKAHIGLDYLSSKFSPDAQSLCKAISLMLSLAFSIFVLIAGGIMFVRTSHAAASTLVCLPDCKLAYIYLCMPVSGFFISAFLLEDLAKLVLSGRKTEDEK